jgi:hypothetical protein
MPVWSHRRIRRRKLAWLREDVLSDEKAEASPAMPLSLNHACRPGRGGRRMRCPCGLGVVWYELRAGWRVERASSA